MGKRLVKNDTLNKRDTQIIHSYFNSKSYELKEVYEKCSVDKCRTYNAIRDIMVNMRYEGYITHDLRIIGHNCNTYSAGFLWCKKGDKKVYLRYYTYKNTRDIYIGELL